MKILGLILTLAFGLSACGGGGGDAVEPDCKVDGDCTLGQVCEAGACVPAPLECELDRDCEELEICTDNECVAVECKVDGDCAVGTCQGYVCVQDCLGGHDQAIQCDNDVMTTLTACAACASSGASCPPGVPPRQISLTECLNIALDLSFECASCYSDLRICSTTYCSVRCDVQFGGDPDSCRCLSCLDTNCDAEFETCAKFSLLEGPPDCLGAPECTP